MNKFKIGDKVVFNRNCSRFPKWILQEVKRLYRIRTIGAIFYDSKTQHTRYYLGSNDKGVDISRYPFRAEMLKLYKMKPHTRRIKINKARLANH